MPSLAALPSRLPGWFKGLLAPGAANVRPTSAQLGYDEWPMDASGIAERRRTTLPAGFRFGPGGAKSVVLRPRGGVKLTCVTGDIWFTKDDDGVDHVLRPGDSMHLADARSLVVSAHDGSLFVERY
jgi:hypothetical protein